MDSDSIVFAINERMKKGPSMACNDDNLGGNLSKYTVNDTINGNGDLTYSIGLLTADELVYAGVSLNGDIRGTYLKMNMHSNDMSWTLTPVGCYKNDGCVHVAYKSSGVTQTYAGVENYIRPSIALKGNVSVSGSGSASDPFVVK